MVDPTFSNLPSPGPEGEDPAASAEAERLFDAWLETVGGTAERPFEQLVAQHPSHEQAFRALHEEWQEIETGIESALPEDLPETGVEDEWGEDILVREAGAVLGDYRLVRLLGEGAVGQVWEAQQISLNRPVALKLLRPNRASAARGLALVHEARAAGRLDHPGIVNVYAAGSIGGVAYLSQQLVKEGRTLGELIEEARRDVPTGLAPFRRTAQLVVDVADAVHVAHEAGILHRDIKPGNILIGGDGRPRVSDFGLAHVVGEDPEQEGLVGTCAYMSPEQATGRGALDARSDVFALGAVLFEALTQRRAFEGDSVPAVLRAVREEDPPDPRSLRARIPGDLALICVKALDKERSQRYADMKSFADDLRRFLADEPILAVPPGPGVRLRKWLRRHPAWAASLGLGVAALVTVSIFLVREVELRRQMVFERNRADQNALTATAAADRADQNALTAAAAATRAEERAEAAEWQGYVANLRASAIALDRGVSEEARRRLEACAPALRGWEWHHDARRVDMTSHTLSGHPGAVTSVAMSADGSRVVTAAREGSVSVWDTASGELLFELAGLPYNLHSVAYAEQTGAVIAGADDGSVLEWRPGVDDIPMTLSFHQAAVRSVAVSADGLVIVSGSDDGSAHVWDRRDERQFTVTPRVPTGVRGVALSRDGRRLLTASRLGTVSLWDVATAELVQELPWDARNEVAVSLDGLGGRRFVGTADGSIRVWETGSTEAGIVLPGDGYGVRAVASTPDGGTLLSATAGGVRLYTVDSVRLPTVLTGHPSTPLCVALSADAQLLVAGCEDGTAVIWDLAQRGASYSLVTGLPHAQSALAVDQNGERVASAGLGERVVRIWDGTSGALQHELSGHETTISAVAMSGDGRLVASGGLGSLEPHVRLWDAVAGKALGIMRGHRLTVSCLAMDLTGAALVSGSYDGTVRRWQGGEQVDRIDAPGRAAVSSVRLTEDGRRLAASCTDGTVFLVALDESPPESLAEGRLDPRLTVLRPSQGLAGGTLEMSQNGRFVVWASNQQDLVLGWDMLTGEEFELEGDGRYGHAVFAMTPDGSRLVSATRGDGSLRLRSRTAPETLSLLTHPAGTIRAAAFSGDGRRLVSAGSDGSLRVWDGPPAQE